jgi:hypothetical protein
MTRMLFSKNVKRKVGRELISVTLCVVMIITAFSVTIGKSNPVNQLQYTFSFQEPGVQGKTVDNAQYSTIQLSGCLGLGKQAGAPTMPVKFVQMLLPPMTTVDTIVVTGTPVELQPSGFNLTAQPIFPYQNEVPLNSPKPDHLEINSNIYSSASMYPAETINDYHIGYSHGYAIVDFSLNPVQYIPKNGQLYYYPDMTVTINLKQTGYQNQFFANNPEDERYVQSLVSNPEIASLYDGLPTFEYPGGLCDPSQHYDYVIITTTQNGLDYWDTSDSTPYNWQSLITFHDADGLSSTVVTVQDINACTDYQNSDPLFNDQPAHIREFCKDAYEDWGTRYILIGGDAPYISARLLSYSYEGPVDSDIYWCNLDNTFNADHDSSWGEEGDLGFDAYSEMYIGRIVCDEPQDVSNWLTKNFYYGDSTDFEYLNNAAFYGGDSTWNAQGDDFVDYGAIKTTTNYLGPNPGAHGAYPTWLGMQYGFETWNQVNPGNLYNLSVKWTAEPLNPGWQGGSKPLAIAGLRNAINNNQVTLLSAFAHADYTMSCDVSDTDWEANYNNTMPFFVTDMGCHCGDFDAGDGILESMLFHSDTKLAFACTYNTGYGWGSFDDTNTSSCLQMKCFWDYFFDVENNSQSQSEWQFGKGQSWSKDTMAPTLNWTYSSAPGSWRGIIESCLFFGDPALTLKTASPSDPPATPSKPAGKNLGIWNVDYIYTSSTSDPNGDQIYYLFDWGDGSTSGWLGPYASGQTGTATHMWTELGTYPVRAKARDVWGAGSVWSDALMVTINDNYPPNAPNITGKTEGKPGSPYLFNIQTDDAEGQDVYYFIDWGDNTTSGWIGPYVSGTMVHVTHTWVTKGTFNVTAKAKDTMDAESDWGYLQVKMPYKFTPFANLLQWLFERFPNAFPMLKHLVGYV